jgi:hypothetical protein
MNRLSQRLILLLIIIVVCISASKTNAQSVVVSKYRNVSSPDPSGEWTELFIIQDNTTLVGYNLRDNNGSQNQWQSGINFKNVPLWKNLRAGTVIVIHHRADGQFIEDVSASDGAIEVDAENTTLFEQVPQSDGSPWTENVLSISTTSDILQLRDASGNHVHALSNGTNIGDYLNLPQPKLQHNAASITGTVRVYPGQSITDYSGNNPSNSKTVESTVNPRKGLPNQGVATTDDLNAPFWRLTRQPVWTTPTLNVAVTATKVALSWNTMTDPNPTDGIQGYLLLVASESQSDTNQLPQDGKSYSVGETIGSWTVLANIPSSQTVTFDDNTSLIPCGIGYKYRVFAFRYAKDETENEAVYSANPKYARGRQYNETDFASARIIKTAPAKPSITASGSLSFCIGKDVTLTTPSISGITFQWLKNNTPISGATLNTLTVSSPGIYSVKVTNINNCSSESDTKEVTILPSPTAQINAPTTSICTGDTINLLAGSADSYQWMNNSTIIPNATGQTYPATSIGQYRVIVRNSDGCTDTSQIISITEKIVSYSFGTTLVDFGKLNDCQSTGEQSTTVQNTSNLPIRIENISVSNGFALVSPSLPATIQQGKSQIFTFQFTPNQAGITNGTADFLAIPCRIAHKLLLKGEKDEAKVSLNITTLNFGTILFCETKTRDTSIEISNNGTSDMTISEATFVPATGFSTQTTFPLVIKPTNKAQILVRFSPTADGLYSSVLNMGYTIGICADTLRVPLAGTVESPIFTVSSTSIQFQPLLACELFRDTTIPLQNTGSFPLVIANQPNDANVRFLNLPINIQPNQTALLAIRFQPQNQGNFSLPIPIVADKCNATTTISIEGSKQGTTFSFTANEIIFDDATPCSNNRQTKSVVLSIGGNTSGTSIKNIILSQPFSVQLSKGQPLSDGMNIAVTFEPTAVGSYSDTLKIIFEPCGIEKTIVLKGRKIAPDFTLTPKNIDFGGIDTGKTSISTVVFRNTGTTSLNLKAISGIIEPFSLVSTSKPLPLLLASGDSLLISIAFSPKDDSQNSIALNCSIDSPCDTLISSILIGRGVVQSAPPDTLRTSASLTIGSGTAQPGQTVSFPVNFISSNSDSLKIIRLDFSVGYNPRLLFAKAVSIPQMYSQFRATLSPNQAGLSHISIENTNGSAATPFVKSGLLATLEAEALLGDELTTPLTLTLDSMVFLRNNAIIKFAISGGTFTLSGDCDLNGRKVTVGGTVSLVQTAAPRGTVGLEFEIVSEERTIITLFNANGIQIRRLIDGELNCGSHSLNFSTRNLAQGIYFAVLRSGNAVRILPIVVEQ